MAQNKPWRTIYGPISFLKDDDKVEGRRRGAIYFDVDRGVPATKDDGGTPISLTIWENFSEVELGDGDWLFVKGPSDTNEKDGKVYYNLSVQELGVLAVTVPPRQEREVKNNGTPKVRRKAQF